MYKWSTRKKQSSALRAKNRDECSMEPISEEIDIVA